MQLSQIIEQDMNLLLPDAADKSTTNKCGLPGETAIPSISVIQNSFSLFHYDAVVIE